MPEISFVNLLVIAAVAVLAPLLLGFLPQLRLPAVVVEIVAGVILGPSVLGWVEADLPVEVPRSLGSPFCCSWPDWRSTCAACAAVRSEPPGWATWSPSCSA